MNILSWDVGIKHLAYNLSEYTINLSENEPLKVNLNIKQWGIINLALEQCNFCESDGEYIYEKQYYCKEHCRRIREKHYCHESECSKKAKYNIDSKKDETIVLKYLCEEHGPKTYNFDSAIEILKVKLIEKLDKIKFENFTIVLIENQPTFKNPKMKAIADTLYAWFIIRKIIDEKVLLPSNIKLISPSRKMGLFVSAEEIKEETKEEIVEETKEEIVKKPKEKTKLTYAEGKKKSIEFCMNIINDHWKNIMKSYSKKDDLADCLLQGYSYFISLKENQPKKIKKVKIKNKKN